LDVKNELNFLFFCKVNVGGEVDLTIVTNAPNVGSRTVGKKVAVATVGTEIDGTLISKRSVGGTISEGMLLDSSALGWSGGAAGNAALMPDNLEPGASPPTSKPRLDEGAASQPSPPSNIAADKKKAKEEAKAAAKAARDAKKAAKTKQKVGGDGGGGDEKDDEAGEEDAP
jgi:tRNA-binding EMAP/Myf-like protein